MIKGVHQLTFRPNTLNSLIDHFTIFNGRTAGRTHARIQDLCQEKGDPGPTARIQDPHMGPIHTYVRSIRTYVRSIHNTYIHRQTDRYTCTCIDGKLKYIHTALSCTEIMSETYMRVHVEAYMRVSLSLNFP